MLNQLAALATQAPDTVALPTLINKLYDNSMYAGLTEEFYNGSGFYNFGYWDNTTRTQKEASENLVDVLLGLIPNKTGKILDVACGTGASTERLLRYYKPSDVVGINISEKQLASCRNRAPGVRFLRIDAADLRFPSDSFDNILCVEAAFHFDTRVKFLHEALRVLKPGGCLALSDFLLRSKYAASFVKRIPLANFVPDIEHYRSLYEQAGFVNVRIVEARAKCWEAHRDHQREFIWKKFLSGTVPPGVLRRVTTGLRQRDWIFKNYMLVSAVKPGYRRDRNEPRGGRR